MKEHNNIYVKIQIEKNQDSGDLRIRTFFDPNAPNFFRDKDGISWCPTQEEIDFINESSGLIPKHRSKDTHAIKKQKLGTLDKDVKESDFKQLADEKDKGEKIFVAADEKTIDELLKRKKDDSGGFIVETSEESVVDKVLKQKKKGRW